MRNVMIWQEPEPHQRVRNLVKSAFTPKAMARWRPIAERVTNELCDRIEAEGHAELVEQYNYELPFNVIAHILGIPEEDFPRIKQLAWDFARAGEKTSLQMSPDAATRPPASSSSTSASWPRRAAASPATTCCRHCSKPRPTASS